VERHQRAGNRDQRLVGAAGGVAVVHLRDQAVELGGPRLQLGGARHED